MIRGPFSWGASERVELFERDEVHVRSVGALLGGCLGDGPLGEQIEVRDMVSAHQVALSDLCAPQPSKTPFLNVSDAEQCLALLGESKTKRAPADLFGEPHLFKSFHVLSRHLTVEAEILLHNLNWYVGEGAE